MDLLSPQEVSKLLSISLASVYRHLKSGVLKGVATPNGVRISPISLAKKIAIPPGKKWVPGGYSFQDCKNPTRWQGLKTYEKDK